MNQLKRENNLYKNQTIVYNYDNGGNITSKVIYPYTTASDLSNEITDQNDIAFINPIRYRGYYYDSETGLYYLKSRYYDPEVGRFINADGYVSTGQGVLGHNMFAYCGNNAVNMTDSNGCDPTPAWAIRINAGNATPADYEKALSVNPNSWCGHAGIAVNSAVGKAILYEQTQHSMMVGAAEHHKKGTTNPSNRNKHEQGATRKQHDNHGEKGDARRKPNPNKRHIQYIEPEYSLGDKLLSGFAILGAGASVAILALDDLTVVGSFDDVAVAPLISVIWDNVAIVFS